MDVKKVCYQMKLNWTTLWQLLGHENIVYFIYCTVPSHLITVQNKILTCLPAFIIIFFLSLSLSLFTCIHACMWCNYSCSYISVSTDLSCLKREMKFKVIAAAYTSSYPFHSFPFLLLLYTPFLPPSLSSSFHLSSFYLAVLSLHQYHFYRSI